MEPLYKPHDVAAALRQRYGAQVHDGARGLHVQFPGVGEAFEFSTANDELTVFTQSWHEDFENIEALEQFLDGLFSDRLEIAVTYRGTTPVAHRGVARHGGETRVVSSTAILVPLFWRRKSRRTLNYKISPNQAMQRIAPRSDA
jgi:hypothetical protein